ncbi:outer membrane protein assembly factor BamB family protein [Mycobacterium shimoidei]|uniref:Pyrrolo-quinoline quinone beta-propeller repeat protein [Gordonia sp. KTR9] n=1 Tax=Mycobacterium shimoidei TaxID=29313 RepID=A0A375YVW1_MYCSH|nr:PQQ-binding-like beta-propeller repeat protein [Mycobacterium shimoidei]MCV7258930.1 PQQ-binding-like beta-propeller repeat protein [Mycobacterium shimoidei]ORW79771.1 hypothetical protein AWC26_12645 [Mycobacterium shimoidei]SRX92989.1 pyrrolo-quinoline quinone beta-propeller repeat protein [Gordonia sp. KTR9] [Mycobacterium shimoidei]
MVIGVVAAVITLVAAGVVVWRWSHSGSDGGAGPVPGQLTREFPTAPSVAWKVTADQLGASAFTLSSAVGDGMIAFPPALVDDGGIAISLPGSDYDSQRKHVLAGVNMATGQPWTTQVEARCPAQIAGHLIACSKSTDDQERFGFIDVRNGTETNTLVVPKGIHGEAAFDGRAVYLVGSDANGSAMRVTKLEGVGHQVWSVAPDVPISSGPGFVWIRVGRGLVGASRNGTQVVLSADDGHLLSKNVGAGEVLADGSLVGSVDSNSQRTTSGYEVVHPNGTTTELPALENPLNGSDGPTQQQPAITSRDLAGMVVVGGRLYRPGASTSTWSAATWISRVVVVTDRITVGVTDKGALQGYDTRTGQTVWTGPNGTVAPWSSRFADAVISDGIRVIALADDGTITATNAATGNPEWKMQGPIPTAGASYYPKNTERTAAYLYAAGDKFVVVTGDSITAYGATGGAAQEPGSSAGHTAGPAEQNGGGYYTRCGSAPIFTPQTFRTASGGLVVTLKVTATCPGGDVLGAAGTSITIHDDSGVIASGTFDFSSNPIGIAPASGSGGGGTTVELTFPQGAFWRLPDTLGTDSAGVDSSAGAAAKPGILVECERPSGGAQQATNPGTTPSATAGSGYTPPGTDIGSNCSQALRSQADSDRSFIMTKLNGHWLAQLSSKHAGLEADGKVWDDCAILHEFLALRLRFTDVRMLWSNEWSVFSEPGWWVTVAAATFPGPDEANVWCQQQGFDNEHCFAKLVSTSAGPDGSTKYW